MYQDRCQSIYIVSGFGTIKLYCFVLHLRTLFIRSSTAYIFIFNSLSTSMLYFFFMIITRLCLAMTKLHITVIIHQRHLKIVPHSIIFLIQILKTNPHIDMDTPRYDMYISVENSFVLPHFCKRSTTNHFCFSRDISINGSSPKHYFADISNTHSSSLSHRDLFSLSFLFINWVN